MIEISIFRDKEDRGELIRKSLSELSNILKEIKIDVATIRVIEDKELELIEHSVNKLKDNGYRINFIDINGSIKCYIIDNNILYFYSEDKRKAKSPTSQALYIARSENKMRGLLLQLLMPHSTTSRHYHKMKTETFYNLEGSCILEIQEGNEKREIILRNNFYTVKPNVIHRIRTENEPALTLIKIVGDPEGLSMQDHHYV
jgi:mannose-6-phosphate isomerase-like protein (cupin superfamily)